MQQSLFKTTEQPGTPTSGVPVQRFVSKFARFLRRQLQCRFGVHWIKVSCVGSEHNCPDCGKHFPAIVWPRC